MKFANQFRIIYFALQNDDVVNVIKNVDFVIPGFDDYVSFESDALLSDADIILFCPNKKPVSIHYLKHWREEIAHSLSLGKTVFVLLVNKNNENYYFLPTLPLEIVSASEVKVYSKHKLMDSFHNNFIDFWNVEAYIKLQNVAEEILFTTKNNDRILGVLCKVGKGNLLLIPNIEYDDEDFWDGNDWTEEAVSFGHKLIQHLSHIHNSLNSETIATQMPDWVSLEEFQLNASIKLIEEVEKNIIVIEELQFKNDDLLNILKDKEILKGLLFETGKALELSVIHALKILGYSAENYNDGILELDQVVLSPENDRFIGECEGKDNKAIDITKFRQLLDSLNEDYERVEINDKAFGLLFGNPQRLTNPIERTVDFTEKCKNGAKREKIGLINTVDLFKAARYISENEDEEYKSKCRVAIKSQLGSIIKLPLPTTKNK